MAIGEARAAAMVAAAVSGIPVFEFAPRSVKESVTGWGAALRGTVTRWDEPTSTAWIEVQGVSYEVRIPAFAGDWIASMVGQAGTQLFTYYHVSERNPSPLLIGFQYLPEREFFRKFIEV